MSWPTWSAAAAPIPAAAPSAALLPNTINSAPAVLPPNLQYSTDQWAQMQQQNWQQQWAQWQQQYQQWHQQYGAEYQKSLAMQGTVAPAQPPMPSMSAGAAMAPPLPVETKPPLPPEEPPAHYPTVPQKQPMMGYSTAPPSLLSQPAQMKRPYSGQEAPAETVKKPNLGNNQWSDAQKQKWSSNQNFSQPPPQTTVQAPSKQTNVEELSEAEKKFDKEFAAWEAQFNKWKEQNANHPDKAQYKEYEKKWESWRNSLLERREQMRKKRLSMASSKQTPSSQQITPAATTTTTTTVISDYKTSPQQSNTSVVAFKNDNSKQESIGGSFLSGSIHSGGIPGLDLVKDDDKEKENEKEENPEPKPNRPDFDAISKGINNILGDQKLMNILSMVAQKPPPNLNNTSGFNQTPKPTPNPASSLEPPMFGNMNVPPPNFGNQPPFAEHSNQSYEEKSNQEEYYQPREAVTNFDDQTRSSFTLGPNDQEQNFRGRQQYRFHEDRGGHFGSGKVNFEGDNFNNSRDNNDNARFNMKNNNFGLERGRDDFGGDGNFGNQRNEDNFRGRNNNADTRGNYNRFGSNRNGPENDRFDDDRNFHEQDDPKHGRFRNTNRFNRQDDYNNYNPSGGYNDYENYEEDDYDDYHNRFQEEEEQYTNDLNERNYRQNREPLVNQAPPPPLMQPIRPQSIENQPPLAPEISNHTMEPPEEEEVFKAATVVEYEHLSRMRPEVEVKVTAVHSFDYRHKPINRIPYTQRPAWLSEAIRFIREFDPMLMREKIPVDRFAVHRKTFDNRYERSWREREGRFNFEERNEREERLSQTDKDNNTHFERRRTEENYRESVNEERWRKESDDSSNRTQNMDLCQPVFNLPDVLEDLSDDDMDWEQDERNKHNDRKSHRENVVTSNPPAPLPSVKEVAIIEDILNPPGRFNRPPRIVIILRGPPGSGKTYLAKLIKDKEVEHGGSAPRILSLDDYFMIEHEKKIVEDGKTVTVKEMVYEYEAEMEDSYRISFIKSFKKTVTDGYFSFIIVDNINDKVKYFGEMWSFAKQNGFQVYICQLDLDPVACTKRNIHNRTECEIEDCIAGWEPTPSHHPTIDATTFLQSNMIAEVEMEVIDQKVPDERGDEFGPPEQSSMASANHPEKTEPWRNTSSWKPSGNRHHQPNQGRRGFAGPTWRSRGNWRR